MAIMDYCAGRKIVDYWAGHDCLDEDQIGYATCLNAASFTETSLTLHFFCVLYVACFGHAPKIHWYLLHSALYEYFPSS